MKQPILILALIFISFQGYSQDEEVKLKRNRIQLSFGYSGATQKQYLYNYLQNSGQEIVKIVKRTDVGGLNALVGYGFMFTDKIGCGLDVSFVLGRAMQGTNHFYDPSYTAQSDYETKSKALFISPNLLIRTPLGSNVALFSKVGATVGRAQTLWEYRDNVDFGSVSSVFEYDLLESGGTSIGYFASFGIEREIKDGISFYATVRYQDIHHTYDQAEYIKYNVDGSDELSSLPISEKEYVFVDEVDNSINQSASAPTHALKFQTSFSSITLGIGLLFSF